MDYDELKKREFHNIVRHLAKRYAIGKSASAKPTHYLKVEYGGREYKRYIDVNYDRLRMTERAKLVENYLETIA